MGVALDRYADQVQHEQRMLQQLLQQQRQDLLQIYAVLASITDGVLVHNLHGQITFMNESARQLLLAHSHESPTRLLANVAHAVERDAGVAVAPGIYTLGNSQQVAWGQRVLTVQVAMLTNELGQRMGTVILLRDASAEHQHQRENDRLRAEIAQMRVSPVPQQDDLQPSRSPLHAGTGRQNHHASTPDRNHA
ncbi:MAG UNVERIFIED_CONTAM: PAS domain-containing protein [Anaerolineae bacterium]